MTSVCPSHVDLDSDPDWSALAGRMVARFPDVAPRTVVDCVAEARFAVGLHALTSDQELTRGELIASNLIGVERAALRRALYRDGPVPLPRSAEIAR